MTIQIKKIMYLHYLLISPSIFCTLLLGFVAIFGDFLVKHSNHDLYKAIFDNATHSVIGGLTWLIISLQFKHNSILFRVTEIFLCSFIASVIDLDHFFMARSIRLKVGFV